MAVSPTRTWPSFFFLSASDRRGRRGSPPAHCVPVRRGAAEVAALVGALSEAQQAVLCVPIRALCDPVADVPPPRLSLADSE